MGILQCIGNTPIASIELNPNPNVRLFAKLEGNNPGGSVKDRIALYMIEAAERDGRLTRDKIILEATSGNTGIGLAMVASAKRYRVKLTMPACVSIERRRILEAFGAELILSPPDEGTDGAIRPFWTSITLTARGTAFSISVATARRSAADIRSALFKTIRSAHSS
jgi:cysteine synthase B